MGASVRPARKRCGAMVPVSHGCGRLPLRRIAAGQRYRHFAWVRAFTLAQNRCGAMVPVSHGCERPSCAETQRRNGTGIPHGCERPPLRGGAAAQWYWHPAWVRVSAPARKRCGAAVRSFRMGASVRPARKRSGATVPASHMGASVRPARRRSGAMVPVSRMGASVHSYAEALQGNGTDISHGCGRSSCAKALRRNGVGISHGCERLPLARRRRIPVLCRRPRCALSGGDIPLPEVCARRCLEGRGVLGRSLEIYATEQRRNICQFARSSMARKRTDPSACGAPTPANSSPT